jgi:hypothetical protein
MYGVFFSQAFEIGTPGILLIEACIAHINLIQGGGQGVW